MNEFIYVLILLTAALVVVSLWLANRYRPRAETPPRPPDASDWHRRALTMKAGEEHGPTKAERFTEKMERVREREMSPIVARFAQAEDAAGLKVVR